MWDCIIQAQPGNRVRHYIPLRGGSPLPYAQVLRLWQADESFRSFFISLLADAPFPAYRWETPSITAATAGRQFEFVLLDAPGLDTAPDVNAFADHFRSAPAGQTVLAFPNLGNDAVLAVPCPARPADSFAHLAAFIRTADNAQKHELWRTVGAAMEQRLASLAPAPVWLSTAGMGVSWLHVRLDSRPKYYGFAPYRQRAS
jgi:hypothetical protein